MTLSIRKITLTSLLALYASQGAEPTSQGSWLSWRPWATTPTASLAKEPISEVSVSVESQSKNRPTLYLAVGFQGSGLTVGGAGFDPGDSTATNWYMGSANLSSAVLPFFQDNSRRTILEISDYGENTNYNEWKPFFSKIQYLDGISLPNEYTCIRNNSFELLLSMPATNMTFLDFSQMFLAISDPDLAIGGMKQIFMKNQGLERISMNRCLMNLKFQIPFVTAVFDGLTPLSHLNHLDLFGVSIDKRGFETLSVYLQNSPLLSHLGIGDGGSGYNGDDLIAFAKSVKSMPQLDSLSVLLCSSDCTDAVTEILSIQPLKKLEIRGNTTSFTDKTSYTMIGSKVAALPVLTNFKTDILKTSQQAEEFCNGYSTGSKTLTTLDFGYSSGFSDATMTSFAGVVSHSPALIRVRFGCSSLTKEGAKRFIENLANWNPTTPLTLADGFSGEGLTEMYPLIEAKKILFYQWNLD